MGLADLFARENRTARLCVGGFCVGMSLLGLLGLRSIGGGGIVGGFLAYFVVEICLMGFFGLILLWVEVCFILERRSRAKGERGKKAN